MPICVPNIDKNSFAIRIRPYKSLFVLSFFSHILSVFLRFAANQFTSDLVEAPACSHVSQSMQTATVSPSFSQGV